MGGFYLVILLVLIFATCWPKSLTVSRLANSLKKSALIPWFVFLFSEYAVALFINYGKCQLSAESSIITGADNPTPTTSQEQQTPSQEVQNSLTQACFV